MTRRTNLTILAAAVAAVPSLSGKEIVGMREIFEASLTQCKKIELHAWPRLHSFWQRLHAYWSHFLLSRVDPFISLRQFRKL